MKKVLEENLIDILNRNNSILFHFESNKTQIDYKLYQDISQNNSIKEIIMAYYEKEKLAFIDTTENSLQNKKKIKI